MADNGATEQWLEISVLGQLLERSGQGPQGVDRRAMFVPGQAFTIAARPGNRLSFAAMFAQSNDLFLAPKAGGAQYRHIRAQAHRIGDGSA